MMRGDMLSEMTPEPVPSNPTALPLVKLMVQNAVLPLPMELGVKMTENVHFPPAVRVTPPQVFVCEYSEALGPLDTILETVTAEVPLLTTVTVFAGLAKPACWLP